MQITLCCKSPSIACMYSQKHDRAYSMDFPSQWRTQMNIHILCKCIKSSSDLWIIKPKPYIIQPISVIMWWPVGHVFVTRGQHSNTLAFRLHTLSGTHIMTSSIWIPGGQKYWQRLHHPLAQPISKQTLNLCACLHIYMCMCLWLERTKEQHVQKKKSERGSETEDKERKWQCLDNERKKLCLLHHFK